MVGIQRIMMKIVFHAAVFCVIVILSVRCTTDDGQWPASSAGTGNILIRVNPAIPAEIYLNYRKTGLSAPSQALTSIPAGRYVIHLKAANYRCEPDSLEVLLGDTQTIEIRFQLIPSPSGQLLVQTRPFTAIFLNRVLLGYADGFGKFRYTGIPTGQYILEMKKNAYAEFRQEINILSGQTTDIQSFTASEGIIPLIEHFANTSCIPCPATDAVLERVFGDVGVARYTSIGYHTNYPGASDPMFLAAQAENTRRMNYYSVPAVPFVIFNGTRINYYANAARLNDSLRLKIPQAKTKTPLAAIQIQPSWNADFNELTGTVQIELFQTLPGQPRLRLACIERSVDFSDPPGANGMKHFFDIIRAFYPDPDGITINNISGQSQSVYYRFTRRAEWGYDLVVVAFLQEDQSKEVFQSAWTKYP